MYADAAGIFPGHASVPLAPQSELRSQMPAGRRRAQVGIADAGGKPAFPGNRNCVLLTCAFALLAVSTARAEKTNLAITNVKLEAGRANHSLVSFDISWSGSWRRKWTEPAGKSPTGKARELENWDAAWVFVKILPEKDSKKSKERNHWQHATLAIDNGDHTAPEGATLDVGLTDDGAKGTGLFIYRDEIGEGDVAYNKVQVRWLHDADKIDPAKAAVKVHGLAMVYVPGGPFKVGPDITLPIDKFADGPKRPIIGGPLVGPADNTQSEWLVSAFGEFVDGGWLGGPMIPFLVDEEWNGPVAEGPRARRIGPKPGLLWGNLVYDYHNRGLSNGWGTMGPVGEGYPPASLHNDYPTGYEAFYRLKYSLTQGEYAAFLNSLPPDVAAGRAFVSGDGGMPSSFITTAFVVVEKIKVSAGPGYKPYTIEEWDGHTITCTSDSPARAEAPKAENGGLDEENPLDGLLDDAIEGRKIKEKAIPIYTARLPERPCGWINWVDGFAYATWAGLRPMTELELRKGRWGGKGSGGVPVTVGTSLGRSFRGSHGDGSTPVGKPGGPLKRKGFKADLGTEFDTFPADWPSGIEGGREGVGGRAYIGGAVGATTRLPRKYWGFGRSANAGRKVKVDSKPSIKPVAWPAETTPKTNASADTAKVSNLKWEAGTKDYSFVTFDLSWNDSWRSSWTEPAEKNVTGEALNIESWDAAWVFLKFHRAGIELAGHATLAPRDGEHLAPAGAVLSVGLNNDGDKGLGVFIYRKAAGHGPVAFKNIRLRWLHGADKAEPSKVKLKAHAIEMVYVAEGAFKSKSPLRQPITAGKKNTYPPRHILTHITTPNATQPGGYYAACGTDVPKSSFWPNGYRAFYCMKHPISQGQYVDFLNSVPADVNAPNNNGVRYQVMPGETPRRYRPVLYKLCGYSIAKDEKGVYRADVPGRACNFLSWPDIMSYSGWAGLRPPTNLEYEKACRGPRDFARDEEAWAGGTCAPAAGLPKSAGPVGSSYWGIRGLSLSGCVHEWPGLMGEGLKGDTFDFQGEHGTGVPESPKVWPYTTAFGEWFAMAWEANGGSHGFCSIGFWVDPMQMGILRRCWMTVDADRTGRFGARAVRTVPFKVDPNAPLKIARPPSLVGCDIAIFQLAGTFRNDGDKALEVELSTPLPDACFPAGTASRTFTAGPEGVSHFDILMALTRDDAGAAMQGGRTLPVKIQTRDGKVLAEQDVPLAITAPNAVPPRAIRSLDGGQVSLRIRNATGRKQALTITLTPPPDVRMPVTEQQIEVTARAKSSIDFPIPRQGFSQEGVSPVPYRFVVGEGRPQLGKTAVELSNRARWWVFRRVKTGPKVQAAGPDDGGLFDDPAMADMLDSERPPGLPPNLFAKSKPPKGWKRIECQESLPLEEVGLLPPPGAAAVAATQVIATADHQASLTVNHKVGTVGQGKRKRDPRLSLRIWVNEKIVYNPQAQKKKTKGKEKEKEKAVPVSLRKGKNTLMIECRSQDSSSVSAGSIIMKFHDARDGSWLSKLRFDAEGKE
ncbi:MAG: SUMF1/EgtB/PvdO family nonheme iron enzyme [Planctomycetota bacterium]|nr:SUMF1/EgtB/PvdO family nonheme iron enzyme [Planctomycetota bacterium]